MSQRSSPWFAGSVALAGLGLIATPSSPQAPANQSSEVTVKGYLTDTLAGGNAANKSNRVFYPTTGGPQC
ncbi:MAG TPA: hypothetical protein VLV89_06545 [Candidatus Acidoferrum sp.]|nr:hypothetical protein [Candidatus Acidoferrum sp.]